MDAIVMAGGLTQRLGMEEKACVMLMDSPLINYLLDSLLGAMHIDRVFVQVSSYSPDTEDCIKRDYRNRVSVLRTSGDNYVGDMVAAVRDSGSSGPVMVLMPDLPLVTSEHIDMMAKAYEGCGFPAMSVYVPIGLYRKLGLRPGTVFNKKGLMIVPVGINILDSLKIDEEQDNYDHVVEIPEVAINVDSVESLRKCQDMLLK
ncbi:NTP transferase domain-containing protein [Methanococcoides methylutens]|uniref:Putative adenosylcobinamide-phosphate guanylyltransferase CobY n=1 Tax=Methanococcoides methylutens MM1 TaxID=1434104 RepID=A0A0E3WZJ2_METMT|nr:NTP transferase domain-containing protein [Methanococcoides methylutens]AKB84340.1 putative adenosylcobinamide-phosphate guanylyltransferase CobY [Methanococcoides methylutens MM1]